MKIDIALNAICFAIAFAKDGVDILNCGPTLERDDVFFKQLKMLVDEAIELHDGHYNEGDEELANCMEWDENYREIAKCKTYEEYIALRNKTIV